MKVIKIVLFILVVLFILFLILGFIGPKTYDVSRSKVIDAPVSKVYEQVSSLSRMAAWDPWKDVMTNMTTSIQGEDGAVGSFRRWESEESVGEERFVELVPNELVRSELKFIKPFEQVAEGYTTTKSVEGGKTQLTLGFKGDNAFIQRAMAMVGMDMEREVGPMFEKGLANIDSIIAEETALQIDSKKKLEKSTRSFGMVELASKSYLTKRETIQSDMKAEFMKLNVSAMITAIGASGASTAGSPSLFYYSWSEDGASVDLCIAIPINDPGLKIEGYQNLTMPQGRAVKHLHQGAMSELAAAHTDMGNYIKGFDLQRSGPVIEEYVGYQTAGEQQNVLIYAYVK